MPSRIDVDDRRCSLGALPLTVTFIGVNAVASWVVPLMSSSSVPPFGTGTLMAPPLVSWPLASKVMRLRGKRAGCIGEAAAGVRVGLVVHSHLPRAGSGGVLVM